MTETRFQHVKEHSPPVGIYYKIPEEGRGKNANTLRGIMKHASCQRGSGGRSGGCRGGCRGGRGGVVVVVVDVVVVVVVELVSCSRSGASGCRGGCCGGQKDSQ